MVIKGLTKLRTGKFYYDRLHEYFMDKYGEYYVDSEWFVNPAPNKWKCYIPALQKTILFVCDDKGIVEEYHVKQL